MKDGSLFSLEHKRETRGGSPRVSIKTIKFRLLYEDAVAPGVKLHSLSLFNNDLFS